MTFNLFAEIRRATEFYLAQTTVGIPKSIQRVKCLDCDQEDFAGGFCYNHWREASKFDRDDYEPDRHQSEDARLDSEQHGQAEGLNRLRYKP